MGAVATIRIGGRWSFGANRKEWGDQEFTVSGIASPVVIRKQGTLLSGQSHLINASNAVTSTIFVYVQNISATSSNGVIRIIDKTTPIGRVAPGEAVHFSPYSSLQSVSLYLPASLCSSIYFDYSIIGNM